MSIKHTKRSDMMPGQDRRGPDGQGPRTGKNRGLCARTDTNMGYESGMGMGRGMGRGRGQCCGANPQGRGACARDVTDGTVKDWLLRQKQALENQLAIITSKLENR